MLVLGLTGTVASGKNFVASIFEELGAKIFDADKEVHDVFENDKNVFDQIKKYFEDSIQNNKINRKILGNLVFNNKEKLNLLEDIIHPEIKRRRENFINKCKKNNESLVILNIPLLFEAKTHLKCDKNILVITPQKLQRERFLKRAKENNNNFDKKLFIEKFDSILQNQMPNYQKEKLADFVIKNDKDKNFVLKQVKEILKKLNI